MDAISTDNTNKTVLFLLLIGLQVFCIYILTYIPFSCCVLFTVSLKKRKSVIIIFLRLAGLSFVRTVCTCTFYGKVVSTDFGCFKCLSK